MELVLTRKNDGSSIIVNMDQVKMLESDSDGKSTHVVFGSDLVRVVKESIADIRKLIGGSEVDAQPLPPPPPPPPEAEVFLGQPADGFIPVLTKVDREIIAVTAKFKITPHGALGTVIVGDPVLQQHGSLQVNVAGQADHDILTAVLVGASALNVAGQETKLLRIQMNDGSLLELLEGTLEP